LQRILFLETWRWCFFFAGFVPIHYVSEGAVRVAEMIVESKLFTVQQALYFAVSIHVSPGHAACVIRRHSSLWSSVSSSLQLALVLSQL